MYCEKYGAQIDDNSTFCTSCGAKIDGHSNVAVEETEENVQSYEFEQQENIGKSSPIKRIIIGAAIVCAAAVVCFGGYKLISGMTGGKVDYAKHPLVYIKDDEMHLLRSGKKESYLVSNDSENIDSYSGLVQVTEDGKTMFFADDYDDGEFRLYYRKTNQKTPKGRDADSKGVKIASGVTSFSIEPNGKFVTYKKGDRLCYTDLKNDRTISSDVNSYYMSEDYKMIMYYKDSDLYLCRADKKSEPEKVDSDVSRIVSDERDYQKIYYIKNEALYVKEYGKDKIKITNDVSDAEVIDGTAFVTKADEVKKSFKDLFDDDCAQSDSQMEEPDYDDFRIEDEESFFGYKTDYDAYYDARDKYNEKKQRDNIREYYEENPQTITTYTLYKINKNEAEKLDDNFISCDLDDRILLKGSSEDNGGKIKLSEIDDMYDAREKISELSENVETDMYILKSNGKFIKADSIDKDADDLRISDDGKYLYCIENKGKNSDLGTLNRYEIGSTSLGKKTKIRDDVSDYGLFEKLIAVYGDGDNGVYDNGKYHRLSDDSISLRYVDKGVLFYFDGYDYDDRSGDLYKYKNGKKTRIDTDVFDCSIRSENMIYYVKDYSTKRSCGDLYRNKGNKAVRLDTDVKYIIY